MEPVVAIAGVVAVLLGGMMLYLVSPVPYYRRMFSDEHWREFYTRMAQAIAAARGMPPNADLSPETGTAFRTSAGLAATCTVNDNPDGATVLRAAFSETGKSSTHAVASHFGCFLLGMLPDQVEAITPFVIIESGAHHLVVALKVHEPELASFAEAQAFHQQHPEPIPFRQVSIEAMEQAAARG